MIVYEYLLIKRAATPFDLEYIHIFTQRFINKKFKKML